MTEPPHTLAPASVLHARAGAAVFVNSAEQLQVVQANVTATFRSAPVVTAVQAVLERLPADRETAIAEAAADSGADPDFIGHCLDMLVETGCVFEAAGDGASTGWPEIDEFYRSMGVDPAHVAGSLSSARVAAVTDSSRREILASLFSRAGLPSAVTDLTAGTSCASALDTIAEALGDGATLLSVWNVPYRSPLARQLNDLAIERGVPALFGGCEGAVARIGPCVLPGNTPCLECMNLRLLSNAAEAEASASLAYRARFQTTVPPSWPVHPVFHDAMAALFVLECVQVARRLPTATHGGFIEHTFGEAEAVRHRLLRVPRCPGCRAARPRRFAWDVDLSAPAAREEVS